MSALLVCIGAAALAFALFSAGFYLTQEKYLFGARRFADGYRYSFGEPHEELWVETADGKRLNAVLFYSERPKGIILYLHGSKMAIDFWGYTSSFYTKHGYDIMYVDYRGFGKSEGRIRSLEQLFADVQRVYDTVRELYPERQITLVGYSLGTGLAAWLASVNDPARVVLLAPYYDYRSIIRKSCPLILPFLIKYKIETYKYLEECEMPVALFHGDRDSVIGYGNSVRLAALLKEGDRFVTLEGEGHDSLIFNRKYKREMAKII